ncbi:Hypothetical protein, putative [Bodo saltans]|uniref:Uncharacterized protein n=1 Tax=Bodo saltans TaxID=75058 RepID=A0A0S4J3J1_BODSA|nr:Hypothetical protein, putative [Bodo saltans]|eukprot:CUG76933.1 Hypothetical protein, putative [Bodo saltans]
MYLQDVLRRYLHPEKVKNCNLFAESRDNQQFLNKGQSNANKIANLGRHRAQSMTDEEVERLAVKSNFGTLERPSGVRWRLSCDCT